MASGFVPLDLNSEWQAIFDMEKRGIRSNLLSKKAEIRPKDKKIEQLIERWNCNLDVFCFFRWSPLRLWESNIVF